VRTPSREGPPAENAETARKQAPPLRASCRWRARTLRARFALVKIRRVERSGRDFQRVPLRALVAFGASGFAQNVVGTCLGVHLFIFYTDTVGLAPLWVSAGLFVATLCDAAANPIMGTVSDHTRGRFGRRRPYILLGAIPYGLFFALVLHPPERLAGAPLGLYLGAALVALFTAANVVHVPVLGLIPEMAQSYHERTRMAAWREALGNIGDLVGLLLPFALRWALSAPGRDGEVATRGAYALTGTLGGGLAVLALLATWRGSYEDPRFQRAVSLPLRAGLAVVRRNQAFRVLAVASSLAGLSLAFSGSLGLYVLEHVVRVTDPIEQAGVFLANGIGALLSYPFWMWYSKRRGKAAAFRLGLFVSSLAFVAVFLLKPGAIAPLLAVMGGSGAANVGFWTLMVTLTADLADLDELETGERREGLFAGFSSLLRKCAFALAAGAVGVGLAAIGYRQGAAEQTPETVLGLKVLFAVPTTALVLVGWYAFRRFPLTPERWAEVAQQLEQRRSAR
jgi:GPH family glycoside/pentoside/hexuronide:cation symporter